MDSKKTSAFLLMLRKNMSLTQKDIAELCSISTQAVSKWEKGENLPDIESLQKLSTLYSVSINEILNGAKEPLVSGSRGDAQKTKIAFSLAAAVFVFVVFFFQYFNPPFSLNTYDIIFKGLGNTFDQYLTTTQFIIFVTHLLILLFTIASVIKLTSRVKKYMFYSSIVAALASFYILSGPQTSLLPQLLLIFLMLVQLVIAWQKPNWIGYNK